jgi:hypothetical protein
MASNNMAYAAAQNSKPQFYFYAATGAGRISCSAAVCDHATRDAGGPLYRYRNDL